MSDLVGYDRRYRSTTTTLTGFYVWAIDGAATTLDICTVDPQGIPPGPPVPPDPIYLGADTLVQQGFVPGDLWLIGPTGTRFEVRSLEVSRIEPYVYARIYKVGLVSAFTGAYRDVVSLEKTDLEILIPTGDKPNNKEPFERCELCGAFYPISQLAKVNGRWYCIPNGHAEEKQ